MNSQHTLHISRIDRRIQQIKVVHLIQGTYITSALLHLLRGQVHKLAAAVDCLSDGLAVALIRILEIRHLIVICSATEPAYCLLLWRDIRSIKN